jgi:chromosome segregation ATPase
VQQQQEELDLQQADLVKSKRETEELRDLIQLLETEKTEGEARLQAASEEVLQQKTALNSYQATVEDLGNQILGLKTRNARLNSEFYFKEGGTADPVAGLQGDLEAAHQQISRLEEKVGRLEAGLSQGAAADSLLSRLEALEEGLAQLKTPRKRKQDSQ